jgi:DNA-binding NarL/FixJ family response regulator
MTTVFIVSASAASRDALQHLAESPEVHVVGGGDDGGALGAGDTPAQVLLVGDEQALEGLLDREDRTSPAVVLLTDEVSRDAMEWLRAQDVPGWAILPTGPTAGELRAAIVAAGAGLAVLPLATANLPFVVRQRDGGGAGESTDRDEGVFGEVLTDRELETLDLLGLGLSNKEIGVRLGISEHTAKFHVASVLAKLGAHNRAEAVRRGIRRGLVMV